MFLPTCSLLLYSIITFTDDKIIEVGVPKTDEIRKYKFTNKI